MTLYAHQLDGIAFLAARPAALLVDEMRLGKTRQALLAAQQLFAARKIDRVLVLAPAAVGSVWREEIEKLETNGLLFITCIYEVKKQLIYGARNHLASTTHLPVAIVSYALLPQPRHVKALSKWCA